MTGEALKWNWWVGHGASVRGDGIYDIDDCLTRDAAIAAGMKETSPGDDFYIIEAVIDDDAEPENDEYQPFTHRRNQALFVHGPAGEPAPVPLEDDA